jgi:tight adherence protein B
VADEFRQVLEDINLGKSLEEALNGLVERNGMDEIEIVATAIVISRETGGNLSDFLNTVSETLRERERIKRQIKSITAQGRLTGRMMLFLTPALFGVMYMFNPEYIGSLLKEPMGMIMLAAAAVSPRRCSCAAAMRCNACRPPTSPASSWSTRRMASASKRPVINFLFVRSEEETL